MPVTYEEVKKLSERTDASSPPILIDVRGPGEVSGGMIPTAHNIVLDEVANAFSSAMDGAAFATKYGFPKPQTTDELVFYCHAGMRAQSGAAAAKEAGYTNVNVYSGSWSDWQAHAAKK